MCELSMQQLASASWFRALDAAKAKGAPELNDFLPPDPDKVQVPEQRFNHQGEAVFYLADTARGAALECDVDDGKPVWVQRIRLAKLERILDLTGDHSLLKCAAIFCGSKEPNVCRPDDLQPQYRVPRFVAECARHAGACGLLAPSAKSGTNLVLFRWERNDFAVEGGPQKKNTPDE